MLPEIVLLIIVRSAVVRMAPPAAAELPENVLLAMIVFGLVVIAREYGIPAVVATGNATARLRDGQLVTVDGSTGFVEVQ